MARMPARLGLRNVRFCLLNKMLLRRAPPAVHVAPFRYNWPKEMRRGLLFALAAVLVTTVASSAAGSAPLQDRLEGRALVQALQDGGYVIYFRHAATDF